MTQTQQPADERVNGGIPAMTAPAAAIPAVVTQPPHSPTAAPTNSGLTTMEPWQTDLLHHPLDDVTSLPQAFARIKQATQTLGFDYVSYCR